MPEVYYEISALLGSIIDVLKGVCFAIGAVSLFPTMFSVFPEMDREHRVRLIVVAAIGWTIFSILVVAGISMSLAWKNMPLIYRMLEGS